MENDMSAENVCNNLKLELNAWKETVSKIAESFESRPGSAKAGVLENIEDIHILVAGGPGKHSGYIAPFGFTAACSVRLSHV